MKYYTYVVLKGSCYKAIVIMFPRVETQKFCAQLSIRNNSYRREIWLGLDMFWALEPSLNDTYAPCTHMTSHFTDWGTIPNYTLQRMYIIK